MRNSGKGRKPSQEKNGAPAWMVTFSDMVTLLLTFFVLLLSMAQLDQLKFKDAAGSLREAFGVLSGADRTEVAKPKIVDFAPIDDDYVTRLYQRVQVSLKRLQIDRDIELVEDRGAVVLRVKDSVLFDSGEATLKPAAYPVLQKIAGLVRPLPLHLRIEGHTDDVPIRMEEKTNWDLSADRAIAALKFFAREDLLPLDRMAAVGYGSQRPLVPNDGPEARALNRRVEFVLESTGSYRQELPYLIDAAEQLPF